MNPAEADKMRVELAEIALQLYPAVVPQLRELFERRGNTPLRDIPDRVLPEMLAEARTFARAHDLREQVRALAHRLIRRGVTVLRLQQCFEAAGASKLSDAPVDVVERLRDELQTWIAGLPELKP